MVETVRLGKPHHDVEILNRLTSRALAEIVERGHGRKPVHRERVPQDGRGLEHRPVGRVERVGRELAERANKSPTFITVLASVSQGRMVPSPGGVLIVSAIVASVLVFANLGIMYIKMAIFAALMLLAGWRTQRRDTWVRRMSSRVANGVRSRLLGERVARGGRMQVAVRFENLAGRAD